MATRSASFLRLDTLLRTWNRVPACRSPSLYGKRLSCPCANHIQGLPPVRKSLVVVLRRNYHQSSSFLFSDIQSMGWVVNPDLTSHLRVSSTTAQLDDSDVRLRDTGMSLCFLGTGAGNPSTKRGNAAIVLRMGSSAFLFDAGEGVLRQFMLSRMNIGDIHKIFITHLHGDHIYGLPGLLLSLQLMATTSNKTQKTRVLQIYGPPGLYNYIASSISLSFTEIRHLQVEVFELVSRDKPTKSAAIVDKTTRQISSSGVHPAAGKHYPEFRNRSLVRRSILQSEDGTWQLCEATEVNSPEDAVRYSSKPKGVYVHAAEIDHVPRLQCFGYMIEEPKTLPRNLDPDRALALGVKPGIKYKMLKSGFSVSRDDDETCQVNAEDVWTDEPPRRSRKVVVLGDCCSVPPPMTNLCRNADVVVHEATFLDTDHGSKVAWGGHSSAATAGRFANAVGAKILVLNHISSSVNGEEAVHALIRESTFVMQGDTQVQVAYDHLELQIPVSGF